ncbi:DUF3616 domain-containing protein [Bradyrhizobium manausense]|uniref:DUF3616 domain-containing protein n=1 Tax=Bradyrhizobium TaxID=374 RepID=UPI001BABCCCB|nr:MULTISPECIES: DUF3616 domain-containing protein [Bradyrhizobium]MBR0825981.1 DUF3616 domain-containing protein [Bradyrhizobium manausense]UVO31984.1 DUF3616 domain-containing protein [Bradyrhizobium arachidis]
MSLPARTRIRPFLALAIIALATASPASADMLEPQSPAWQLSEPFKKSTDARTNLSGAACATPKSCLIVNDEKKYAQFFKIEGTTIDPGKVIRLLGDQASGDPDAEGAAYDDGYFYVIGSHGRKRHDPNDSNPTSYHVFRIPVDKTTGKPAFPISDDEVIGVEASVTRLRGAIKDALPAAYDKPLGDNGANIEGIAVADGQMYLGFRGPSDDGKAYILAVDAKAVFAESTPLNAELKTLPLGTTVGIRDIAAVSGGLLLLTGPVNEQQITPAIVFYDPKTGTLGTSHPLKVADTTAKAETLLVLSDAAGQPWRVLVMFDGPENGAPAEYRVPR